MMATQKPSTREQRRARRAVRQSPTLTQALADAGYTHRRAERPGVPFSAHDILDAKGNVVATLRSHEAWEWLRATGRPLCVCDAHVAGETRHDARCPRTTQARDTEGGNGE